MSYVLVAIDFSDVTDDLVAAANKYARAGSVPVVLVHVAPPAVGFSMGEAPSDVPPETVAELIEARREQLRDIAGRFEQDVSVEPILMQGSAVEGIIDEAQQRNAELIIIGTHGHGRLYDLIVGSVANGVIRHTTCPVLVVPSKND